MYTPPHFKEPDQGKIYEFIGRSSLAAVVSVDGQVPIATHLPLELSQDAQGRKVLSGHMARANRQWKTFDPGREILAIFTGPDSYVSARWYNHVNVPTWNYIAVHAYGKPALVTDPGELYALLKSAVDKNEGAAPNAYKIEDLPKEYLEREMKAIVGFRLVIDRVEANYKLSQNRGDEDYKNVVSELEKTGCPRSLAVAEEMRKKRKS